MWYTVLLISKLEQFHQLYSSTVHTESFKHMNRLVICWGSSRWGWRTHHYKEGMVLMDIAVGGHLATPSASKMSQTAGTF